MGGSAGARPRLADVLVENATSEEEVIAIVERIINWYRDCGREVRLGRIVEELGIEQFKEEVLK